MEVISYLHTLADLLLEKNPWHQLNIRQGGPQSQCGHYKEIKNPLAQLGFKPHTFQPVA